MRGQLSIEFMIVFTGMLLIVASVTYPLYNRSRADAEKLAALLDSREAATVLANAINSVYAGGPGAKQTVEYWLPKGVVGISANPSVDISRKGRMDVVIELDFNGDWVWDNTTDSTIVTPTLLPSQWHENGDERDDNWMRENAITVHDENFKLDPRVRTKHRTTLEYSYRAGPSLLRTWDLSQVEKQKLKTRLFGEKVKVKAENEETTIEVKLKVGKEKVEGSGTNFTLTATSGGLTVTVDVNAPLVYIYFIPHPHELYRQILVHDEVIAYA